MKMDTHNRPLITPIGSCRVTGPLRRLQDRSQAVLNRSGVYGYCHSSAEAVQMARHLLGETTIPKHVWPLVSKFEDRPDDHDPSDAYVVEISSAKSITLEGWPIQLNYLAASFPDLFEKPETARLFWQSVDQNNLEAKEAYLSALPLSDTDRATLLGIRRSWATPDTLFADMALILQLLPNVIFVTHANAIRPNGHPLEGRSNFIQMVEDAGKQLGATVLNPTDMMNGVGQRNALSDPDEGLAHYTPAFEDLVGYAIEYALKRDVPSRPGNWDQPTAEREALFEAAAEQIIDPDLSMARLTRFTKTQPESVAKPIWHLIEAGAECPGDVMGRIAPHLGPFDRTMMWVRHSIGTPADIVPFTDLEVANLIHAVPINERYVKIPKILRLWGRMPTSHVHLAVEDWLTSLANDPLPLARACTELLRIRAEYRGALRHIADLRHVMVSLCDQSRTRKNLDKIEEINGALPIRIQSVDLFLCRAHFREGRDGDAIRVGLHAQSLAPDNLTNLVMLLRAAVRSGDVRAAGFAKRVLHLAPKDSSFVHEALRALDQDEAAA